MSKRFFDHDPLTGITQWFVDGEKDSFHLIREQDVEPILELNKAKQGMGRGYYAADPDMWKVASIPLMVQFKWATEHGITDITDPEHWPRVQRLLNDPEWRYLKTADIII
jgi:hypothetical protein